MAPQSARSEWPPQPPSNTVIPRLRVPTRRTTSSLAPCWRSRPAPRHAGPSSSSCRRL
ncbi:hypothetical protein B0H10DRAFT_2113895, partial [Mycena sp. CBHHK59/15]